MASHAPARPPIDYRALEEAMAHCDRVIRETRRRLQGVAAGDAVPSAARVAPPGLDEVS